MLLYPWLTVWRCKPLAPYNLKRPTMIWLLLLPVPISHSFYSAPNFWLFHGTKWLTKNLNWYVEIYNWSLYYSSSKWTILWHLLLNLQLSDYESTCNTLLPNDWLNIKIHYFLLQWINIRWLVLLNLCLNIRWPIPLAPLLPQSLTHLSLHLSHCTVFHKNEWVKT